jgi:hypothetical protein
MTPLFTAALEAMTFALLQLKSASICFNCLAETASDLFGI